MRLSLIPFLLPAFTLAACGPKDAPPEAAQAEEQAEAPDQKLEAEAEQAPEEAPGQEADAPDPKAAESEDGAQPWSPIALEALTDAQKEALETGRKARATVAERLVTNLRQALEEGGLPHGVEFCHVAAPGLHRDDLPETVTLARTSHRLRNPDNAPPSWAQAHVQKEANEPLLVAHEDGRVAEMVPITTAEFCTSCHGEADTFPEPLVAQLKAKYPEDKATGFKDGDLRGWFWFESTPQ